MQVHPNHNVLRKDKMLSYRRETALQGVLVMAQNGRLELGLGEYLRTL